MKKIIAIIMSVVIMCSIMLPVFAVETVDEDTDAVVLEAAEVALDMPVAIDDAEEEGGFDFAALLNHPIIQALMASRGASEIITIVLQVLPYFTDGGETLKGMAEEEIAKIVTKLADELGDMIVDGKVNAEVFLPDYITKIRNQLGIGKESLTTAERATEPEQELSTEPITAPQFKPGDVNGDGEITVLDARLILRRAIKLITLTPGQEKLADADGDGKITVVDARIVLRIATKLDVPGVDVVVK